MDIAMLAANHILMYVLSDFWFLGCFDSFVDA
jgi:hypothetical protein